MNIINILKALIENKMMNYLKNDDELQSYFNSHLSSLKLSQILFKLLLCRAALN